jgi:glycerol kinase
VPGARERAGRGELMFGTVDCYLLWRLTGGKVHATDATNASRTLLFNIHTGAWDDELLKILRVPRSMLPEVKDSSHHFGETVVDLFGGAIALRNLHAVRDAAHVQLGDRRALAGVDVLGVEDHVELAVHIDDGTLPQRAGGNFSHEFVLDPAAA